MSTIWINGEELKNVNASTVEELMKELEVSPITLVEHNGKALHRAEWSTMPIRPGDHLEIALSHCRRIRVTVEKKEEDFRKLRANVCQPLEGRLS